MAKVLVALLRFSAKQQKEILQKVDEQVSQVSVDQPAEGYQYTTLHLSSLH